jgi:2-keto-3-deoxy-L-rhamnonate aldolase RhmA
MNGTFRERLISGEMLIGSVVSIPSPEVAEILSAIGFDWLFLDTEHGAFDAVQALPLLQAAGTCPCVIRVPSGDEVWIKKALDIGADGIIVPGVNTADDAVRIVRRCKYPPQGNRGVGIGRAHTFGLRFRDYLETANQSTAVIVQAEHMEAVRHISDIAQVKGVDAVLVGPYDLSASMGKIGQTTDREVRRAVNRICDGCREHGVRLGIFGLSVNAVMPYIEQGFNLVAVGTDTCFLIDAARTALSELKPGVEKLQ